MISVDISTRACPGSILMIDEEDAHLLIGVKWTPERRSSGLFYAHRRPQGSPKLYLHRVITRAGKGAIVDHIDRNGLNNTRDNLRLVDASTNLWNRAGIGQSRFKGVHRKRDKWAAAINLADRNWSLGVFETEEEAALAFDAAALATGRDRTGLNFPHLDTIPEFRLCNRERNAWGFPGIRQTSPGKYGVRVIRAGRRFSLGTFNSPAEAIAAALGADHV